MDEGFKPVNTDIAWAPAVANLAQATRGWGVLESGGDTSGKLIEAGTPGMSVKTSAICSVNIDLDISSVPAAQSIAIDAAHGSLARYDIVYVAKGAVVLSETAGTPAATPVPPELPNDAVLLGIVNVPAAASAITNSNITDTRQFVKLANRVTVCPHGGGDYATLAAAISGVSTGATIKLLEGTHLIADETVIGNKILDIYGEGKNTIIKIADNGSSTAYGLRISTGLTLKNLTLDGNASNTATGELLQIYGDGSGGETVNDVTIQDIWLTNLNAEFIVGTGTGMNDFQVKNVTSLNNLPLDFLNFNVPVNCFASQVIVKDCNVQIAGDGPFMKIVVATTGYGSNYFGTGNRITYATGGSNGVAFNWSEVNRGVISNNIAFANDTGRMQIFANLIECNYLTITGNNVKGANYAGIYCNPLDDSTITGNIIIGSGAVYTAGIHFDSGDRNVVMGNHIDIWNTDAITIDSGSDKHVVVGNYSGGDGIVDNGASSVVADNNDNG